MPLNPAWQKAFQAALEFRQKPRKADEIVNRWGRLEPAQRRRAHRLFFAYLRHRGAVEEALRPFLKRPPRPAAQTLLELAGSELSLGEAPPPVLIDDAVEQAKILLSPAETRFVNALLRRLADVLERSPLPLRSTHPAWLVERWEAQFGAPATLELLRWNQAEPETWVRWSAPGPAPDDWEAGPWAGFSRVTPETREAILAAVERGEAYIQDPFTRHPIELLAPGPGHTVLDLCAAPGGKSRALLEWMPGTGPDLLVAIDQPGPRLVRLQENLSRARAATRVSVHSADVRALEPAWFAERKLPARYDRVLVDVPCSNTGVIRRRPDVRWLLDPARRDGLTTLQHELLAAAARCVAPGGTLVYSTCSLEAEENEAIVDAFLADHPEFAGGPARTSRPWLDRHDGGAAFPLHRRAATPIA